MLKPVDGATPRSYLFLWFIQTASDYHMLPAKSPGDLGHGTQGKDEHLMQKLIRIHNFKAEPDKQVEICQQSFCATGHAFML